MMSSSCITVTVNDSRVKRMPENLALEHALMKAEEPDVSEVVSDTQG